MVLSVNNICNSVNHNTPAVRRYVRKIHQDNDDICNSTLTTQKCVENTIPEHGRQTSEKHTGYQLSALFISLPSVNGRQIPA